VLEQVPSYEPALELLLRIRATAPSTKNVTATSSAAALTACTKEVRASSLEKYGGRALPFSASVYR